MGSTTIANQILDFYSKVSFHGTLPDGINILNPFAASEDIRQICEIFYQKYYSDSHPRALILGINPGRLGAGATGIPFTDTKRLNTECQIHYDKFQTHEPSSVFVYEVIKAYGGAERFYSQFYINSVCPLGFTKQLEGSKVVNYNYYDSLKLQNAVKEFIIDNIKKQVIIAGRRDISFCFGTGKNAAYLNKLNTEFHFFDKIIALEHPRFIMQYKAKSKDQYIEQYLEAFSSI